MKTLASWKFLFYMIYLVNVDTSTGSENIHVPSGVINMAKIWLDSSHRNILDIFGQLIFVDMRIWVSIESSTHYFLKIVIFVLTSWEALKCMFYLGTVEVVFY